MKYTACFVCLFVAMRLLVGQEAPIRTEKGITFSVSKVKKATKSLVTVSYKTALESALKHKIEAFPVQKTAQSLVPTQAHGFMEALHFAYADHRPLVLSPDMIWTLIAQGVSIHTNQHSKKMLPKIVAHGGKKEIRIQTDSSFRKGENNPWQEVFAAFADSVQRGIRPEFYTLMVPQFSTTSPLETTVYQVIIMDALQKSFGLVGATGCGIPEITLEGAVSDWEQIRACLDSLQAYEGLEDWAKGLIPVLDNFVSAAKGKPDKWFWEQMYKSVEYYAVDYVSGWSLKFFPYLKHETPTKKISESNPDKQVSIIEYKPNPFCTGENYHFSNVRLKDLPSGLSNCPFSWEIYQQPQSKPKIYQMCVYAGFVGFAQDETTKALRPELAWAVADKKATRKSKPTNNPNIVSKVRSDYWSPLQVLKPEILPIFAPEKAKTYAAGLRLLDEYLVEKIAQHPQNEGLKGRVKISFVVTWSGKVADVKIKIPANPFADAAAKTLIENLPLWSPARFKNKEAMDTDNIKELFVVNYPCSVWVDFGEDSKQSVKKE